jgi:hypothetical protein
MFSSDSLFAEAIANKQFRCTASARALVGHGQEDDDARRAYMHRANFWAERVAMMQAWSDYLDDLRESRQVVPLMKSPIRNVIFVADLSAPTGCVAIKPQQAASGEARALFLIVAFAPSPLRWLGHHAAGQD